MTPDLFIIFMFAMAFAVGIAIVWALTRLIDALLDAALSSFEDGTAAPPQHDDGLLEDDFTRAIRDFGVTRRESSDHAG